MNVNQYSNLLQIVYDQTINKHAMADRLGNARGKASKYDIFIKSSLYPMVSETYTDFRKGRHYISSNLMHRINSETATFSEVYQEGDEYKIRGTNISFTADQIPPINGNSLGEVKAKDNVLDFGSDKCFKYVSKDGELHKLYTKSNGYITQIVSEYLRGVSHDAAMWDYASFWNYLMSDDLTYIGLYRSVQQIKDYLEEAGIQKGFFTVKMGNCEATQYYTAGKYRMPVQSKRSYDEYYQHLTTNSGLLRGYEPGSVFTIEDKEYVLSEFHTLDIPYGEDIFNIVDFRGGHL